LTQKSRNKGSGYERKIAAYLTEKTGKVFKKCPGSGAIGTISGIEGLQGDIIRADLRVIPYVECKKYKDFRLEHFLHKQGDEWKWVNQTLGNIKPERIWVIIFQKDYGRHHWCLTNANVDIFPNFLIQVIEGDPWTLSTLDIAFTDPKFMKLFNYE